MVSLNSSQDIWEGRAHILPPSGICRHFFTPEDVIGWIQDPASFMDWMANTSDALFTFIKTEGLEGLFRNLFTRT